MNILEEIPKLKETFSATKSKIDRWAGDDKQHIFQELQKKHIQRVETENGKVFLIAS